jgi:uncharacterized protein (DUF983 family)
MLHCTTGAAERPAKGTPMSWDPTRGAPDARAAPQPILVGLVRGARGRCPCCGEGRLFAGYLKLVPECSVCGAALGRIRADDAPPYFTIFLAGHLLLPGVFWVEKGWQPPMWLHMTVWLPVFTIACLLLLRPVKGAVVAWMLRLGLTGDEQGAPVPVAPRRGAGDA